MAEEQQTQPGTLELVHACGRRSLKSETCRTMFRIISRCYSQPQPLSKTVPTPLKDPSSDNIRIELGEGREKDVVGVRFKDTGTTIDEMKIMMRVEGEIGVGGKGLEDCGLSRVQKSLINELENVIGGTGKPVRDNASLGKNEGVGQEVLGKKHSMECGIGILGSSLHNREDEKRTSEVGEKHEVRKTDGGLEKSVCVASVLDGRIEEVEMSGEFWGDDGISEGVMPMEKQDSDMQAPENFVYKEGTGSGKNGKANRKVPLPNSFVMNAEKKVESNREAKDGVFKHQMLCKRKVVVYEDPFLMEKPSSHDKPNKPHRAKRQKKAHKAIDQKKDSSSGGKKQMTSDEASEQKNDGVHEAKNQNKGHEAVGQKKDGGDTDKAKKQKKVDKVMEHKKESSHGAEKQKKGYESVEKKKDSGHIVGRNKKGEQDNSYVAQNQKKVDGTINKNIDNVLKDTVGCGVARVDGLAVLNAATGQRTTPHDVQDAGNKKKRGGGSKERKKMRERKKRAQKNKEQGVRRLKLRPVQISKPVAYCRHFINGRCQEGEKCKFSHDTIPVTKSKPCCHFARQSCMKGDDCPFDHQLSKYLCTNFTLNGFCSKGQACLFSHKSPLKEELPSTSNVQKPDSKSPSLLDTSDSKKQPFIGSSAQTGKALTNSVGVVSDKNAAEQSTGKSLLQTPARFLKGISFLSTRTLSKADSSHPQSENLTLVSNEGIKFGNVADLSSSGKLQSLNKTPVQTPVQPPKGINFLSFGRHPLDDTVMNVTGIPINEGSPAKISTSSSSISEKQKGPPPVSDNIVKVSREASHHVLQMATRMKEVTQRNETPPSILKPPFSSPGASTSGSGTSADANMFSMARTSKSVDSGKTASSKHRHPSANPWTLSAMPDALGSSSNYLGQTSNSSQKALMSTLAFAAKLESEMKANSWRTADNSVSDDKAVARSSSGVPSDSSLQASKLLDFLASIGNNAKNR